VMEKMNDFVYRSHPIYKWAKNIFSSIILPKRGIRPTERGREKLLSEKTGTRKKHHSRLHIWGIRGEAIEAKQIHPEM
jgi:hypothetical protein